MTSLSELVKFKNDLLITINRLSLDRAINEKIDLIKSLTTHDESVNYLQLLENHALRYQQLISDSNSIIEIIKNSVSQIDADINAIANSIDTSNFTEENMIFHLATTKEIEAILHSRLGVSSDWHFPGLQICRYISDDHWQVQSKLQDFSSNAKSRIDSMVSCDPLYIVGNNIKALENVISPFTDVYQRRLRLYEIKNRQFDSLPYNQFGIIMCWDYFNYLPLSTIELYLADLIKLLRPGGKLLFSFNNCDFASSAKLAEDGRACWATTSILKDLIEKLGYEYAVTENLPTDDIFDTWVSWMEITKPGLLTTVKRSQAVGQVLAK